MKDLILKIVRAFVALVSTDVADQATIADLKGQLAAALAQVKANTFSDTETTEINSAANLVAAATPPTAPAVAAVAAVAPTPGASASDLPPTVTAAASSPDVAAAAATPPATSVPTAPAPAPGPTSVPPTP
jgi:hypothetical protein